MEPDPDETGGGSAASECPGPPVVIASAPPFDCLRWETMSETNGRTRTAPRTVIHHRRRGLRTEAGRKKKEGRGKKEEKHHDMIKIHRSRPFVIPTKAGIW